MKLPEELQFIANARMDGRLCIIMGATSSVGYHAARRAGQIMSWYAGTAKKL